jgi:ribonuclease R
VLDGDIVEVELIEYPSKNTAATGKIVRVLGHADDSSIEVDLIIAHHGLETSFSQSTLDEAAALKLDVATALGRGYRDKRAERIITIDPSDARDYDDAVSCSFDGQNYHLGVYIADVSTYVPWNGPLDLDARRRATSVYLVDRVLPMLPEKISNDLCSLVPGEDRLTLGVEVVLTPSGKIVESEVFPAIINSKARLSYEQAQALVECEQGRADTESAGIGTLGTEAADLEAADAGITESAAAYGARLQRALRSCDFASGSKPIEDAELPAVRESIVALEQLAQRLFAVRFEAGCMDFDRAEARVTLDPSGIPTGVVLRHRTPATQAIEEAMILANRVVAEWLGNQNMPCVYRVHEEPNGDSLYALFRILQTIPGLEVDEFGFCSGDPKALQSVLAQVRGTDEQQLVAFLMLRSMKRAVYSAEDQPHYGVALEHYCHFTSPIRRYPDLLVHRMAKAATFGPDGTFGAQRDALPQLAEHSSKMERTAEKASYQSQMCKLVELMRADIGKSFDAIVSGVSTFGLNLQLENTATGTLPMSEMGEEYFAFDPDAHTLTGSDTGIIYRLGQKLRVQLIGADPHARRLDFRLGV